MSTKRYRDPAGLLPDRLEVKLDGDAGDAATINRLLSAASPSGRIERLSKQPGMKKLAAQLLRDLHATQSGDGSLPLLLADIAAAETKAIYLRAAPAAIEVKNRRKGSSRGGKNRPKPEWHSKAVNHAKTLMADGTENHELTAKCARRFSKSTDAVRRVLDAAGLFEKRKSRAK